ncbi:MAG TPA: 3'(2'),5'-bisphosphate nucleotidase CysQ [Acidimicrobiales bacterium]|nr:3'(2'),5'-bisphosphate nucleotidase CysQ [Acidimicrobiales bacterium]
MPATASDHELARRAAYEAGQLLLELRVRTGLHPETMRADGDWQAHKHLVQLLKVERPDDAVLSEEGADNPSRLEKSRAWIVDPLDGTREFGEPGRTDWAVHVALAIDGVLVAGAVALPAVDLVLATDEPPVVPPIGDRPMRVVTSRSRRPYASVLVAEALGAELVPLGSAGAKAMAVVLGHVDAYAHAGGMYEWDSAAPAAVAQAAGLHASRLDGSPLRYNERDPWLPDLLICRPELAETCLNALQ